MKKNRAKNLLDEHVPDIDMSPMIDLVFLLLIFFMTSSSMITYLKDQKVELPIADSAQVPKSMQSRYLVNVYAEGSYGDDHGATVSLGEFKQALQGLHVANPGFRLFIRADRRATHGAVRQLMDIARNVGVHHIIFSTYTSRR